MSAELEKEILLAVKEQICPLLKEPVVLDALMKLLTSVRVKKAMNSLTETQPLIMSIRKHQETEKERSLIDTMMYLFEVEVSANLIFDILIMLLSAKQRYFHIEPDRDHLFIRHATTIEDLTSKSITLGIKRNFLIRNELSCVEKYVKLSLRNKIAHMDYEINENGTFFKYDYDGNKIKKKRVDLQHRLDEIITFTSTVIHQINLIVKETE
jgi:hypothetical protein